MLHVGLDFGQLALAHKRADIGLVEALDEALGYGGAGRFGQEGQLVEVFLGAGVGLALVGHGHQHGRFVVDGGVVGAVLGGFGQNAAGAALHAIDGAGVAGAVLAFAGVAAFGSRFICHEKEK